MSNLEAKMKARTMYVERGVLINDCARVVGYCRETVKRWADEDGWREQRRLRILEQDAYLNAKLMRLS